MKPEYNNNNKEIYFIIGYFQSEITVILDIWPLRTVVSITYERFYHLIWYFLYIILYFT